MSALCVSLNMWFLIFFVRSPSHMDNIWTVWVLLSFDTPKEETMQEAAQFVQLTQTLCYDLARAEKATDEKKRLNMWFLKHPPRKQTCAPRWSFIAT